MTDIRLIACDMDGTLLDDSKKIPAENIAAVRRAKEAGIYFVIATGRHDSMIKAYLDELKIEMPVISCNGAMVREPFSGKAFSLHPLSPGRTLDIIEAAKSVGADFHVYCTNTVYGEKASGKIAYYLERNRDLPPREQIRVFTDPDCRRFMEETDEDFYKVLVLSDDPGLLAEAKDRIYKKTGIEAAQSDSNLIDVMESGITKAIALSELCAELGISRGQTAAIGDQMNDLQMIEWAGCGIAMANAEERVKSEADMVTVRTNKDAGVAEAIDRLLASAK